MVALDIADALRRERRRAKYARDVASARRRWAALIEELGGHCVVCGVVDGLSIDHVRGRDWNPRKKSLHCRVARYWREYRAGVPLRVLCVAHNSSYTPPHRAQYEATL
jgi:hypothetical protein